MLERLRIMFKWILRRRTVCVLFSKDDRKGVYEVIRRTWFKPYRMGRNRNGIMGIWFRNLSFLETALLAASLKMVFEKRAPSSKQIDWTTYQTILKIYPGAA